MRNQIPAQAGRKKSVYIGKKITSIYGESTNQDSKPKQINTNGMPNHWAIPVFSNNRVDQISVMFSPRKILVKHFSSFPASCLECIHGGPQRGILKLYWA